MVPYEGQKSQSMKSSILRLDQVSLRTRGLTVRVESPVVEERLGEGSGIHLEAVLLLQIESAG